MTELDLQALGIWWIPLAPRVARYATNVNLWAIEDGDLGFTLLGCGSGSPDSLIALTSGLADAGATLRDVRRIILTCARNEHADGLRWMLEHAGRLIEVVTPDSASPQLSHSSAAWRVLRDGETVQFRHFTATALQCGCHRPRITCLHAGPDRLLFSADHLVDDGGLSARFAHESAPDGPRAYRSFLERLAGLDVSVVLPGIGPPFGGHRRVVRASLSQPSLSLPDGAQRLRRGWRLAPARPAALRPPVPAAPRNARNRRNAQPPPANKEQQG